MALLASRVTSLASDRARPLGLAQPDQAELDPALKKKWFVIFFMYLFILCFVFLHYKNANLILKYSVFYEMLQKYISKKNTLFSCIQLSISKIK
jgi:hypothetical protein